VTRTLRRLVVAIAVPVALLLAGCGTPQSGAAAVVGDRRISITEVQDAYRDITVLVGQDLQATQADMLTFLIIEPYLTKAAADAGQGVSEDDAEKVFDEVRERLPKPSEGALLVARAVAARERLQSTLPPEQVQQIFTDVIAEIRKDGVEVNPRYGGSFDYEQLVIVPGAEDWLRTPKPSASAGQPSPEESVPEESVPEQSVPQESVPEESVPGETPGPSETLPEETPLPGETPTPETTSTS
jgi:hypothetical protein